MEGDGKEMHWNRGEELAGRDGGNARNYRRCRDKRVKRKQKGDWKKRGDVSKKISKPVFFPLPADREGCKDSEAARRITNLWAPLVSYRRRLSISNSPFVLQGSTRKETRLDGEQAKRKVREDESLPARPRKKNERR